MILFDVNGMNSGILGVSYSYLYCLVELLCVHSGIFKKLSKPANSIIPLIIDQLFITIVALFQNEFVFKTS